MEPKIRVKGFSGEWETRQVGELCEVLTGFPFEGSKILPKGKELLMRGINITEGVIRHNEDIDRYYNEDTSSLSKYRLKKNDLVIGMDGSKVGKNSALVTEREENSLLVQRVARLRNDDVFLIRLIQIAIGSQRFYEYVDSMKTSSAIPHISPSDIKNFTLTVSNDSEVESLKQVKAASLQSLFPQEGETTPRVRFKGFEGEWEKVSLGEETYRAGIKNHDNLPLESYSISNEYGFLPQTVQFENGGTMATADKRMYYIVSSNSFGYNPARINVGSLGYYTGEKDVIVSSLYEIFKTSDRICDLFLLYWFKTPLFHKLIEQYQEGGVRFYFFYDKLCKCNTLIPTIEEQTAIASYFTSLDAQITLQTQRLEKLKQIKSACLDNMFV